MEELLRVDREAWLEEVRELKEFFKSLGERLPEVLWNELYMLESRLKG